MMVKQRILRWLYPQSESERMDFREWLTRANAEAEDLTRTLDKDQEKLREVLKKHIKT